MGADQNIDWAKAAISALEWWQDAGVDSLVDDLPQDWLGATPAAALKTRPAAAESVVAETLPTTLEAFLTWRTGDTAPDAAWPGAVIGASGPMTADLMILVDCPERDDGRTLMGGAVGTLFDRMLAAIGRSRDDVHLAAVCAKRPIAGRMPADLADRLGALAQHHVMLAAPKRLLVMGNAASRAILGVDQTESRGGLRTLNHKGGKVTEVVASFHPRFLMEKPAAKAEAWKDLQMLIGNAR